MKINLSLCRAPDHFFLAAPPVIVMRLKIFPENIQNSYFKKTSCMLPISIKSTSGWVLLKRQNAKKKKKNFGGSKPSTKLTLNWWHCGYCDYSQSCETMKKHFTYKFFEKNVILSTLITFCYMKLCYHYNAWVTDVYMAYMFDRNSETKALQIDTLFESSLKSIGYFNCSTALSVLLDPSCKGNSLTRVSWTLQAQIVTWGPK